MSRKIRFTATIDPNHPLVEMLAGGKPGHGIRPAKAALGTLFEALLDGLAAKDPSKAAAAQELVSIAAAEAGRTYLAKVEELDWSPEAEAEVYRLKRAASALGKVEAALRPAAPPSPSFPAAMAAQRSTSGKARQ